MDKSRRNFLVGTALVSAGAATAAAQHEHHGMPAAPAAQAPAPEPAAKAVRRTKRQAAPATKPVPVEVPDVPKLPFEMDGDVKVFRLRAEPVQREFIPGKVVNVWGFNGSMPGPTIEITEGDRVRIVVENGLPEEFAPHWHGLEVPFEMDGVPGLQQDPIPPGGSYTYEFTIEQNGTFFYHSHMAMQEMMGMLGLFVVHPKVAHDPPVDRDFAVIWQEWAILPNNNTPNTMAMEFNWLTMNGRTGPHATPMLAKQGERVRIRLVNLGMDHHPIHLHGYQFEVTGTEGGRKNPGAWFKENTVILGVAQARDIEFVANRTGAWMLHCHLPHHMMNGMASMVGPMMGIGKGIETGSVESGMGIVHGDHALSEDMAPKLGRTLGVGASGEERVTNLPVTDEGRALAQGGADHSRMDHSKMDHSQTGPGQQGGHEGHRMGAVAPNATSVPGYPQDMAMAMDDLVAKPETHGLRPTWTIGMMGMMTMIRVLTPEQYDEIERLKKNWTPPERQQDAQHDHSHMHHD